MELGAFTAVPVRAQGARVAVRAARGGVRRAADAHLRAHRRRRQRSARRASTPSCATSSRARATVMSDVEQAARAQPHLPRPHGRHRHHHARTTRSRTAAPARSARSTGVAYDVRKDHPYLVYDRFDFDVPGRLGRRQLRSLLVRVEEIEQSMRILDQALKQIPAGPVMIDDPRDRAAAQERDLQHDRGDDPPLQAHHGRHPGAARRGLLVHRGRQRRARLLHRRPTAPAARGSAACRPPCFAATAVLQQGAAAACSSPTSSRPSA